MAEHKSVARRSNRHTGKEYGKGYPYKMDQEFTVEFGPFQGMSLSAQIGLEHSHIQNAFDTSIRQNGSLALLAKRETSNAGAELLGQFQMRVNSFLYHIEFLDDGGTDIDVRLTKTDDTTATRQSTFAHASKRIDAEPWGVRIYFVNENLADVRFYDDATQSFGTVSNSPDNGKFLFLLDNNMVQISQDSSTKLWSAAWAVDSDPTDWTGAGSGSNTFPSYLGDPVGYGRMGIRMVVVFEFGGVSLNPTGTIPVYQFVEEPGISGGIGEVASDKTNIYYVDRVQQLVQFQGNREIRMGQGFQMQAETTAVFFSQSCGWLVVAVGVSGLTNHVLFYDIKTLEVVGRSVSVGTQVYMTDVPRPNGISQLHMNKAADGEGQKYSFPNNTDGETNTTGSGIIQTEFVSFPHVVTIVKIRLIYGERTDASLANITCGIQWFPGTLASPPTRGDSGLIAPTNIAEGAAPAMDYDFNQAVDSFKVRIQWPALSETDLEIKKIIVYCRVASDDDIEVLA